MPFLILLGTFSITASSMLNLTASAQAILNLKRKKGWGKLFEVVCSGQFFILVKICISTLLGGQMLLSNPHGRVYCVPQKVQYDPENIKLGNAGFYSLYRMAQNNRIYSLMIMDTD